MFEREREIIKQFPDSGVSKALELVLETLDEAERGLREIADNKGSRIISTRSIQAQRTLERMDFISKRPIFNQTKQENKNGSNT